MAFFLAIVIRHLTGIAGIPLFLCFNGIITCRRGRVFFLFKPLPFLFFAIGLGGLIGTGQSGGLAID